jgi:sn-glycerol 3-phosphate transport system ATP-binding protein
MSGFLELKGLKKQFGDVVVLEKLDISINEGEFLVLVGPSGCGKSTVLRTIAGLEEPTEGAVFIAGKNVVGVEPKERDIAMVFQSYALYPHMNVYDNMAFGLRMARKLSEEEIKKRVGEASEVLRLQKYMDRKPKDLSGGQRQRVALGRAIVRKPKVFLFDEPLSNLDAHLRNQMRVEIRRLQQDLGVTSVYVTHDQVEATTMGDRVAVLQGGRLQQIGTPAEVYGKPANAFVAEFIGVPEMNFLSGTGENGRVKLADGAFEMANAPTGNLTVGLRPESLVLSREAAPGTLEAKVELVENLGAQALVHLRMKNGESLRALTPYNEQPRLGENLQVTWPSGSVHLFAPESGEALGAK